MSYSVEDVNSCTKKFVFKFEAVDLTTQIEVALKSKQKDSNLKGFRKGKAPLTMIKEMYGPQVENEALYTFVSQEFYSAIQKEGIKAVGYPQFSNTDFEKESNNVNFEATVEVIPAITLGDYSKYEFKKDDTKVSDSEVDDLIKKYLEPKSEMVEVTENVALENGHHAVFDFIGEKEDGEKPENMAGKEFLLEIGSGQFIPGFEEGMIGLKKGDKKVIDLTFPENYHEEALKNEKVKFHVELLEIKEKKMPNLDDELAKEFDFSSVEDMKTKTRERFEYQKDREASEKLHQAILEKFVADNAFEIPKTLIDEQKKSIVKDVAGNLKQQGFTDEMVKTYFEKWEGDVDTKASFQVKSGLILDTLAKKHEIESTEADLEDKFKEMAEQSAMEIEQVKEYYLKNANVKSNMMYAIREEKTFEKIKSEMKIS
jgi:trigger factor